MKTVRIITGAALCVILQTGALYSIELALAWIIVSIFFFHEQETFLFAISAGVFRDSISTPFGYHIILYAVLACIGCILVKTIITHRTTIAFFALTVVLVILFFTLSFLFVFIFEMAVADGGYYSTPPGQLFNYVVMGGISIGIVALICYGFLERFFPSQSSYRI